jgi:hypothetical protein
MKKSIILGAALLMSVVACKKEEAQISQKESKFKTSSKSLSVNENIFDLGLFTGNIDINFNEEGLVSANDGNLNNYLASNSFGDVVEACWAQRRKTNSNVGTNQIVISTIDMIEESNTLQTQSSAPTPSGPVGGSPAYGILHTGSGSGGPNHYNAYGILHTGSGSGGPHTCYGNIQVTATAGFKMSGRIISQEGFEITETNMVSVLKNDGLSMIEGSFSVRINANAVEFSDVETWNKMPETYRETYTVLTNELQSTMGNSEIEVIIYANGSSVIKKDGVEMSYGVYTEADIEMAQSAYWNIPGFNLVFPMTFWAAHNEGWIPYY